MNISDLKTVIPLMKNCIFNSRIVEDYGDIYFLPESICVFNDECLVQHPVEKNKAEFSVDFKVFEKVYGRLPEKEASFSIMEDLLIIKADKTTVKLNLKKRDMSALKKIIRLCEVEMKKMKAPDEFFYWLDLAATSLAPFGTLSVPFYSYLLYEDGEFTACSSSKGAKIKHEVGLKECPPFIISIDAVNMLVSIYNALSERDDLHANKEVRWLITKDKLFFDFDGILKVSVNNSYGVVTYDIEKVSPIFELKGDKIEYPGKDVFLEILDRVSLFPKEFEDTTLRIFQKIDSDGILFFSKNESGSIKERFKIRQKTKEGTYSFSPKDFTAILSKMLFPSKEKIYAEICTHPGGNVLISFTNEKCKYVISIAPHKANKDKE